ncbi:phosphatidylserine decarboxylase [Rhizoctonia solani]|uniref:Phosphatidylserine decarboxylase n=1 Tax=Rhizoctonia solani TaxID=456999 RepID=A0A8H7M137_9AGAM|nr:phosphatidylserine decarboxylase [Rhizoctonia solani]
MPFGSRPYNGWLPSSRAVYNKFINDLLEEATKRHEQNAQHVASVAEFKKDIEANATMVGLFNKSFVQASSETCFEILLQVLDIIVSGPPRCVQAIESDGTETHEPVGVPIYIVLDLLINTSAGYTLFNMGEFNSAIKKLLNSWGEYLTTADSAKTLTNEAGGWFSPLGLSILQADERGNFDATYVEPDPKAVNKGYASWDAFFTRQVQSSARPVEQAPAGTVVYNACESTVDRVRYNVQTHDKFWLKGMAYSLYDMLNGREDIAKQFVGGQYTRHSSARMTIIAGIAPSAAKWLTQYSSPQPWLTIAAARAIITIQAPGPIGLVCFIAVGMVEVSTCDIRVKPGDSVSPGTELGMFHFGGSSHAVIFGPHVKLAYRNEVKPEVHQRQGEIQIDTQGATWKKKRKAKRDQTKTDKESKEHKSVLNFANLPIELFLERAALDNVGLPSCPDNSVSESEYAALMFFEICAECGKAAVRQVDPILFVRGCDKAIALKVDHTSDVANLLLCSPYLVLPRGKTRIVWCQVKEYERIREIVDELEKGDGTTFKNWICESYDFMQTWHKAIDPLHKWVKNREEKEKNARAFQIQTRLIKLSWDAVDISECKEPTQEWKTLVFKTKLLDDNEWRDILPHLLDALEQVYEKRIEEEVYHREIERGIIIGNWLGGWTDKNTERWKTRWRDPVNPTSGSESIGTSEMMLYSQGIKKFSTTLSIPWAPRSSKVMTTCPHVIELLANDLPMDEFERKFEEKEEAAVLELLPEGLKSAEMRTWEFEWVSCTNNEGAVTTGDTLSTNAKILLRADCLLNVSIGLYTHYHYPNNLGALKGVSFYDLDSAKVAKAILRGLGRPNAS